MTLDVLRRVLEDAVVELPLGDLADAVGLCAAAQARLVARIMASPTPTSAKLVDAAEMAAILGTPENWVRDRARAGAIPFRRLGHYMRFDPPEVLEAVRHLSLHNSQLRGLKKRKENRGGTRRVSIGCPASAPEEAPGG